MMYCIAILCDAVPPFYTDVHSTFLPFYYLHFQLQRRTTKSLHSFLVCFIQNGEAQNFHLEPAM